MPDVEGGHRSVLKNGAVCCALNAFWCWSAQHMLGTLQPSQGSGSWTYLTAPMSVQKSEALSIVCAVTVLERLSQVVLYGLPQTLSQRHLSLGGADARATTLVITGAAVSAEEPEPKPWFIFCVIHECSASNACLTLHKPSERNWAVKFSLSSTSQEETFWLFGSPWLEIDLFFPDWRREGDTRQIYLLPSKLHIQPFPFTLIH